MKNDRPTIEHLSIDALVPYARNSRTHSAEQVAQIAGSIKEFGFTNPVLIDADGGIIAGHGRVMAARKLGLTEVPCIRLGYLTDAQKRAYVIADNKLALNAGWDDEMLRLELNELREANVDLSLVGFTEEEIGGFTALVPEFEPGTEGEQGKLDELAPKMVKCPTCNHVFNSRGYEQD
jgi:ParB-like chromosome segregation protein Spo0J